MSQSFDDLSHRMTVPANRFRRSAGVMALAAALLLSAPVAMAQTQPQPTPDTGSAALASAPALTSQTPAPDVPPGLGEGILVSVNDDMVTSYDLKQRMLLLIVTSGVQVTQENYQAFQSQALRGLIDERLEQQEMDHWKVKVTDKEIDDEVERMAKQSNLTSPQLLAELKKAGIEPATLRTQIKAETGWNELVGGRYHSNALVGKDQVDAMMDKVIADGEKPQYEVAEIFLDATTAGGIENAQKGAQQLYDQINQKVAPFQAVARQFSNAPSAPQGGDEGWLVSGSIDPQIEDTLKTLKVGDMSKPVTTKDGAYIFLLRDKTDGHADMVVRLKQAAVPLPANATPAQVEAAQVELANFKAKAPTCDAAEAFETAKTPTQVQVMDLGETELSTLLPNYASALRPLKSGQITDPLRNTQNVGLLYVCDKRLAGENSPTRDQIENQLVNERLSMLGRRYLRDIRNTATIENH